MLRTITAPDDKHLAELLDALAPREGSQPSILKGVSLLRLTKSHTRVPVVYEPSIIFVGQGRKVGYLGDEVYIYDPGHYLVMSVPLPFECETQATPKKPLLAVSLKVDPVVLGELLLEMQEGAASACEVPRGMYSTQMTPQLTSAVVRLLECLQSRTDARMLGKQIVREIVYRVLCGECGDALRAVAIKHSHFGRISKVLRRMHADYLSELDVQSLAREASMSVSTFHHIFKAVTSTSPLQYLKSIRLHKARLMMTQDGLSAAAAAGRVGYESPSQFSREFKRFFGKSPVEEAERIRARTP